MNAEKMTDTVEEWIGDLREHENKMKEMKFREICEAEQKQHATRLEKFQLIVTQLKSCVERGQDSLERNICPEIIQTNNAFLGRFDELVDARKPDLYKSPYLNYLAEKKFHILDRVIVTKTDPSRCLAEGHDSEERTKSNFAVVTRDSEELQCYRQDDQSKVDLLTPQCARQHRVEVQLNGDPLTGSPCVMQGHQPASLSICF